MILNAESNFEILKQRMIGVAPSFAHQIAPVYEILKWNWFGIENYPTEEQIHEHIVELVEGLSYNKCSSISSGGIKVSICDDEGFPMGRLTMEIKKEMSL